jgi:hypothetical protein
VIRITDWNALPLVMRVEDICRLTGLAKGTIWNKCQRKQAICGGPINFDEKPYLWYREHVKAFFERGGTVRVALTAKKKPFQRAQELREASALLLGQAS